MSRTHAALPSGAVALDGRPAAIRWPARHRLPAYVGALVPLADLGGLLLAALLVGLWMAAARGTAAADATTHVNAMAALLAPLVLHDRHFGEQVWRSQWTRLAQTHAWRYAVFAAVIVGLAWVSRPQGIQPDPMRSSGAWLTTAALAALLGLVLTSLARTMVAWAVQRLRLRGRLSEAVAVVGDGPLARRFVAALAQAPAGSAELLGVFDDDSRSERQPPVASIDALIALAARQRIDWIVLALPEAHGLRPERQARRAQLIRRLGALGIPMGSCAGHVGLTGPGLDDAHLGERLPLGMLAPRPIARWQALLKSAEDRLLGGLLLLLFAPLMAAVALAIWLDSPGPLLFRQRRHALDNREFDILKFRTMRWTPQVSAAPLQQTQRSDARITRVGRVLRATSLDELPQLFNVVAGTMSLVGPRPHATDMRTEARLGADIIASYAHRHRVKPGITGWAQVNGARGATETAAQLRRRVELDLHYIANWSLLLDLRILLRTAGVVLRRTNAY
ncbi:exopolysaccharide biosynthesis polyprenyl glycosylphosphotransferase [Leptothrix discophora]|uniref:Exopolysaccharide biosynthesis polyprenyl glycosylphosphotransferase n=1 Tax=Leptothrix discophora TaxID=89 RepID=A0ABT9G8M3_LEPDI|nr:exopolysaccharide biosynthesis polyprenyl glycosylphosphotransferase [Leptothrix discophora]MDP4302812.1 exopolysaccharide biosynthesis polyprenyl glycosylphosphotransferase [Leptothrix discophora]